MLEFYRAEPAYARLVVWWVLDGRDLTELRPIDAAPVREWMATTRAEPATQIDPRLASVAVVHMLIASSVFHDYLAQLLSDLPEEELQAGLIAAARGLLDWNNR